MTNAERLSIFKAQTQNVRELEKMWKSLNRQINRCYVANQKGEAELHTRLMALVYCALSEATFSKLIHTPYGLTLSDVSQVKRTVVETSISGGWEKAIELASARVDSPKSNHVPNLRRALQRLVNEYVEVPSLVRNKLAHGQWVTALNRKNSAINAELTTQIAELNAVQLLRKKKALNSLVAILENLIESPNKAHFNQYFGLIAELEAEWKATENFTLDSKIDSLAKKRSYTIQQ